MKDIDPLLTTTAGFADAMLGLPLYKWQADALKPIEKWFNTKKRQQICVVTPNGSGKDERIIPSAFYYWLYHNPRGRVVLTSKSDIQLTSQTLPNLEKHWRKLGWDEPVGSPRWILETPVEEGESSGGSGLCFVTNDGARVEGHHTRPGEPLMMVVNEAKFITPDIWEGIDRCTPDVLLVLSSPGLEEGRLYEICTKLQDQFTIIKAGLKDCPHITQEQINKVVRIYGIDHPITRSTLFGEFMKHDDTISYVITADELESCYLFPPDHVPGFRYGFFDFSEGRAENVFVIRDGNKFTIADAWRDKNEDAIVGRSIVLMRRHNLKPSQCGGDAAAKSILDKLALSGFAIHRQNFGAKDKFNVYKSWVAWAWYTAVQKIKNRELILPNDPIFKAQITARRKEFTTMGLLALEDKDDMHKRGVESPDRVDAFVGCASAVDMSFFENDKGEDNEYSKHSEALHGMSVGF